VLLITAKISMMRSARTVQGCEVQARHADPYARYRMSIHQRMGLGWCLSYQAHDVVDAVSTL
jgi:hypothetical protein